MNLQERRDVLVKWGKRIGQDEDFDFIVSKSSAYNPWFDEKNIREGVTAICDQYLSEEKLNQWISNYEFFENNPQKIGLVLAGNIPMVGFHDVLSVFLSGHKSQIKLSDKDNILLPYVLKVLESIDSRTVDYFEFVERLQDFDAVIATGSNTAGQYFERYFGKVPHIIRKNRSGVAVVQAQTSKAQIKKLGMDIFSYYGLGCRNVSKIYLEEGLKVDKVFDELNDFKFVNQHAKYMNNYDYNYALYQMNDDNFFTNDFLILKPDQNISSRIAAVNYEYFNDLDKLEEHLHSCKNEIQCVISNPVFKDLKVIPFGESQSPELWDYADGVDTMEFLLRLSRA